MTVDYPYSGHHGITPDRVAAVAEHTLGQLAGVYGLEELRAHREAWELGDRLMVELEARGPRMLSELVVYLLTPQARAQAGQMVDSVPQVPRTTPTAVATASVVCPDPAGHRRLERDAAQEMRPAAVYRPGHCCWCDKRLPDMPYDHERQGL